MHCRCPPGAAGRGAGGGAGIAGLAAARAIERAGIDDVHLIELEDEAGGHPRGHRLAGFDCPLGAHYLPVPGERRPRCAAAGDWAWRRWRTAAWHDERHLCHAPQSGLFIDGEWHEGLLPPGEPGSRLLAQYRPLVPPGRRGAAAGRPPRLPALRTVVGSPARRPRWTSADLRRLAGCASGRRARPALVPTTAATTTAPTPRPADLGLGRAAPFRQSPRFPCAGDAGDAEREPVLTWPEGNAWLARRLAAPLHGRTAAHRPAALRLDESARRSHGSGMRGPIVRGLAGLAVVLALPLHVAAWLWA